MNAKQQLKKEIDNLRDLYRVGSVKPSAISLTPETFDALCDAFKAIGLIANRPDFGDAGYSRTREIQILKDIAKNSIT